MSRDRPVFLNPLKIRMPVTAVVSILHRISGMVLILMLPLFLWGLSQVVGSPEDYQDFIIYLQNPFLCFLYWGGITAFVYHLLAGLRHLIMDCGWCESLKLGRVTAYTVLVLTASLSIWIGFRLC